MDEAKTQKMVIIATHGPDDPEKATLPFVVANAARAMDVDVVVALQGYGVTLAKKGCYEHVLAGGMDPLKKLVDSLLELGGKIWVCTPCIKSRGIEKDMLVDGAELMAGGKLVQTCVEADAVITY